MRHLSAHEHPKWLGEVEKFAVQPGFDIDFGELSSVGGVEAAV